MTLSVAAKHLLAEFPLPNGAINVLPIKSNNDEKLLVWVDEKYLKMLKGFPRVYEGFKVEVEARPNISAVSC